MVSVKKFVFTIAAEYEGDKELKQLQNDLTIIGKIDSFEKLRKSWQQINQDFAAAKARVRELRTELKNSGGKEVEKQYAAATVEVKKLGTALGKQRTKLDASHTALEATGVAVSGLAGEYRRLKTASDGQGKNLAASMRLGIKSTHDVQTEIAALNRAYDQLRASGTLTGRELAAAWGQVVTKTGKMRDEARLYTSQLALMQRGWAGVLTTAGSVYAATRGIQFFAGYDDSLRDIAVFTQATKEQVSSIDVVMRHLGATTRFTAAEIAQGTAELAQSGLSVQEIFTTLPHVIDLSASSGMQFKQSADVLTDTIKQFNLQTSDAGRVTDVLVAGYTTAGHTAEQLGNALSYVGPIAKSMGYSLEETVAIINTLAEAGYKGQRGGTALRGGFVRLIKPAKEAAGVLKKYKIQIYDSQGEIRNFADIMEDLGAATLSQTEIFTLFGQEAGPGMQAVLAQGSDAIRGFTADLELAGGTAKRIASDKEGGLGGSLRSLMSSMQAIVIAFGGSVEPAIGKVADMVTVLARAVATLPPEVLQVISVMGGAVVALTAWQLGLRYIFTAIQLGIVSTGLIPWLASIGTTALASVAGVATLQAALAGAALAAGGLIAGYKVGEWLTMRGAVQGVAEAAQELEHNTANLDARFQEISTVTGVVVTSMEDLDRAVQSGAIHYDELTGTWKAGAGEMAAATQQSAAVQVAAVTGATDAMKKQYQAYAAEVLKLQDEIAGREQSLAEQLREMSRLGMDDGYSKWKDRKAEAEEYEAAARQAAEAGDFTTAVKYADQARNAFAELSSAHWGVYEDVLTQQEALTASMAGVKSAGELAIDILGKQKEAAAAAAVALDMEHGFALSDEFSAAADQIAEVEKKTTAYGKAVDAVGKKWTTVHKENKTQGLSALNDLQRKITDMDGQSITVLAKVVQAKALGGPIQALATGGVSGWRDITAGARLPGWGGGDKVRLLGEAGEVMINKQASKAGGYRAALAFNAQRWDIVVAELVKRFGNVLPAMQHGGALLPTFSLPPLPSIQSLQTGGQVMAASGSGAGGDTVNINFSFASGRSVGPFQGTRAQVRALDRERQRMELGSS